MFSISLSLKLALRRNVETAHRLRARGAKKPEGLLPEKQGGWGERGRGERERAHAVADESPGELA